MYIFMIISATLFAVCQGIVSSVWCHGSHQDHRHCTFHNLCYHPYLNQYLFFHANTSTISGVDDPNEQIDLVRLASITGNEELYLNYVSLPASKASKRFDIETVENPALLIKRTQPLDPFHAIHDDLLPIFSTLKYLCFNDVSKCLNDFIIVFEDQVKSGFYTDLLPNVMFLSRYATFFNDDQILCYEKLHVGLEHDTLWFNPGIDRQSVSHFEDPKRGILTDFRDFVFKNLNIELPFPSSADTSSKKVVLLKSEVFANSEEIGRLIQSKGWIVKIIQPQFNNIRELIHEIMDARVLLGFHSSFHVLALFLPPNSGLIELFPYGLDDSILPAFSKLCHLLGLVCQSWTNDNATNSLPNEKALKIAARLEPQMTDGGDKVDLMNLPVFCCNKEDAVLQFKLNQVTSVDINDFLPTLAGMFNELESQSSIKNEEVDNQWIIPARIHGANCRHDESLNIVQITWNSPFNLDYISSDIIYEALVEGENFVDSSLEHLGSFSTADRRLDISLSGMQMRKYSKIKARIDVVVLDNNLRSGEAIVTCDLDKF